MRNFINLFFKLIYQYFFKIRFFIAKKVIFFIFKNKKNSLFFKNLSILINNFYKDGFVKIDSYYSDREIEYLNNISNQVLNDTKNVNNQLDIEKVDGSIKIKHLTKTYKEFKRFTNDSIIQVFSIIFNFKYINPDVILNISHDGNFYQNLIPGICTKNIADTPHIDAKDGFKRYLKGFIILENLSQENGATKIIPKSSENKKIVNLLNVKGKSDELKNEIEKIKNISEDVSLTGKKGDLVLFDSRNIHWAGNLNKGMRKLLWVYF